MRRQHEQQVHQLSALLRKAINVGIPVPDEETTNNNSNNSSIAAAAAASLSLSKPTTIKPEPAQRDAKLLASMVADGSLSCGQLPLSSASPLLRTREQQLLHNAAWSSPTSDSRGRMSTSRSHSPCRPEGTHPRAVLPGLPGRGTASVSLLEVGTRVDEGLHENGSPAPPSIPRSTHGSTHGSSAGKSWMTPRLASSVESHPPMSPRKSVPQGYRELPNELSLAAEQHLGLERQACRTVWQTPHLSGSLSARETRLAAARCVPMVAPPPMASVINACQSTVALPISTGGHSRPSEQGSASVTRVPGHKRGVISVPLSREAPAPKPEALRRTAGGESMAQWLAKARVDGALQGGAARGSPAVPVEATPSDEHTVVFQRALSPRNRDGAQTAGRAEWLEECSSPVRSPERSRASFAA